TRTTSRLIKDKREVARRGEAAAIPTAWEYAPAPESREIVHFEDRYGLYIGGQFLEPLSNERYTTIDPAREEPLAEIAQAGQAEADRRRRADHPVELPLAHARVEDRAGARGREHRGAEAGGDDAALGAALLRRRPSGGAAAGRREHRHRRWTHRRRARLAPRRRQDRVHRIDRGGQGHPAHAGREREAAHPRARREGRERH